MINQNNKLWIDADWPAPKHVRAGTSLRLGGHSTPPYDELNLALHVGDVIDDVNQNRIKLAQFLNLKSEPSWLSQTHSPEIIFVDDNLKNFKADASYTTKKHIVCTILTADCVPILFCNKAGTKIAAIHAGWKGICAGIIENSINAFAEPEAPIVWIGPHVSKYHYEVGQDVYDRCIKHSNSIKAAFEKKENKYWYADLGKIVRILIENAGIGAIYECKLCTYKRNDLFFSYRRDGITGRTASMIWME